MGPANSCVVAKPDKYPASFRVRFNLYDFGVYQELALLCRHAFGKNDAS
jgi:hypothetical protein